MIFALREIHKFMGLDNQDAVFEALCTVVADEENSSDLVEHIARLLVRCDEAEFGGGPRFESRREETIQVLEPLFHRDDIKVRAVAAELLARLGALPEAKAQLTLKEMLAATGAIMTTRLQRPSSPPSAVRPSRQIRQLPAPQKSVQRKSKTPIPGLPVPRRSMST